MRSGKGFPYPEHHPAARAEQRLTVRAAQRSAFQAAKAVTFCASARRAGRQGLHARNRTLRFTRHGAAHTRGSAASEATGHRSAAFLLCKSIAKIRNVPFPRPCGATGNDAQKLHAPAFAHFRGAVLTHEVLCGAIRCVPARAVFSQSTPSKQGAVRPNTYDIYPGGTAVRRAAGSTRMLL